MAWNDKKWTRRTFMVGTTLGLAGCAITPRRSANYVSPNEKMNLAGIGVGGKGDGNVWDCRSENIVALCDVDWNRAAGTFGKFPDAAKYKDYRVMLEKEKNLDGVIISTPDHVHAPAALMAMRMGLHVYCEKPLTHTIEEARLMAKVANQYGVQTQMGNQGHSGDGARKVCEAVWAGRLGQVRECHVWTNRPVWPQGIPTPTEEHPVPDHLDWDLWLGPAPYRPYNSAYLPFGWRGWWDYGCGALGDMACHIMDPVYWAMRLYLVSPTSVECVAMDGEMRDSFPNGSVIKYEFPRRPGMSELTVYWYDGGRRPAHPEGVPTSYDLGGNGSLFVGDKAVMTAGEYGGNPRLLPEDQMRYFEWPAEVIPRVDNHHQDWIRACKGGKPACSNFDYAGPFTEMVLLGNLALRYPNQKLEWNGPLMSVTNVPDAAQYIRKEYRAGFEIV